MSKKQDKRGNASQQDDDMNRVLDHQEDGARPPNGHVEPAGNAPSQTEPHETPRVKVKNEADDPQPIEAYPDSQVNTQEMQDPGVLVNRQEDGESGFDLREASLENETATHSQSTVALNQAEHDGLATGAYQDSEFDASAIPDDDDIEMDDAVTEYQKRPVFNPQSKSVTFDIGPPSAVQTTSGVKRSIEPYTAVQTSSSPEEVGDHPAEVQRTTGSHLHKIQDDHCKTVGWYIRNNAIRFVNRYGKRSHAWYRVEKEASSFEYEQNPPPADNLDNAANRISSMKLPNGKPRYQRSNWVGIEAIAWQTKWRQGSYESLEEQLNAELDEIEPQGSKNDGRPHRLPPIWVLGVWEDVNDKQRKVYGWEPKSSLTRVFADEPKWIPFNAAYHCLNRYLAVHRGEAEAASRSPSVLPDLTSRKIKPQARFGGQRSNQKTSSDHDLTRSSSKNPTKTASRHRSVTPKRRSNRLLSYRTVRAGSESDEESSSDHSEEDEVNPSSDDTVYSDYEGTKQGKTDKQMTERERNRMLRDLEAEMKRNEKLKKRLMKVA
ncbi:hypothetical protein HIM_11490 [Hirsutella minnesotensis 3608]|uniref:Uncharacterized protein n=1 Tax=Hirsutella minnesotensis 3608 TaxID=1043627 RepID=A0A0F7ZWK3_9HYPO|nr:hypothetical protein HIM_11490 [Hirsutella minnesotensis 3608]